MSSTNNELKLIKLADFLPCNNKKFGCDYVAPRYTILNYASLKENTKKPDMFRFTNKKTSKQSRKLRTGFMTTGVDWYMMNANKKNVVGKTAPSRKAKKQIFKKNMVKKTRKARK